MCAGGPAQMAAKGRRAKREREKAKLSLAPQLSPLFSLKAFKDIIAFS